MKRNEYLFYDKIKCIYRSISKEVLNDFTKLFYIEHPTKTFENRKSYLRKNWLKRQEKPMTPRMFKSEYFKYPFSKLTVDGRRIFDSASEFLEMDIEPFCKRIESYSNLQVELTIDRDTNYRYMYVFNINGVEDNPNIDYYEIKYLGIDIPNEINIRIEPPKHKSSLDIHSYRGTLKYQGNKIILTFENRDDYISAIFNTDLIHNHTKHLIGVGIGIADINQKIPVAKKVLLRKEKIEDSEELYLILNETEMVSAEENTYKFKHNDKDFNPSHLEKYITKIERLDKLFEKLSKQQKYSSFYEQLAFKEFSATSNIFQKIKENHPYYINYRKRVLDILLKSYEHEEYKKLYIVMPISDDDDNIFANQSSKALLLQEQFKQISRSVKIEIIFVLRHKEKKFVQEFQKFLSDVQKNITIRFIWRSQIEHEVNSIDFLLTDKNNFVVSKLLRVHNPVFNIFKDATTIEEHEAMYRIVRNRSINYEELLTKGERGCQSLNPILKNLIGKWYFHLYGTQKLWRGEIEIAKDSRVTAISENGERGKGEIVHKTHQSIIFLEEIKTNRLVTITFDHQAYKTAHAFTVQVVGKQFKSDLELLSIGLFSRQPIEREGFQTILGDVDEVRILENENIQKRLSEYLGERFHL
jgi:hypothetical protein